MSWRLLFAMLLLLAGASAWGGLRLGEWLVAHGPDTAAPVAPPDRLAGVTILDADGKPFLAQPPQPLVDGRLATPEAPISVAWEIPTDALERILGNPAIGLATTSITLEEAQQIADAQSEFGPLQGIADVSALGLEGSGSGLPTPGSSAWPLQPIEAPPAVPVAPSSPSPAAPATQQDWRAQLQQELAVCERQGFFSRPTCAWNARNRYCEPNQAWGQVQECPARH